MPLKVPASLSTKRNTGCNSRRARGCCLHSLGTHMLALVQGSCPTGHARHAAPKPPGDICFARWHGLHTGPPVRGCVRPKPGGQPGAQAEAFPGAGLGSVPLMHSRHTPAPPGAAEVALHGEHLPVDAVKPVPGRHAGGGRGHRWVAGWWVDGWCPMGLMRGWLVRGQYCAHKQLRPARSGQANAPKKHPLAHPPVMQTVPSGAATVPAAAQLVHLASTPPGDICAVRLQARHTSWRALATRPKPAAHPATHALRARFGMVLAAHAAHTADPPALTWLPVHGVHFLVWRLYPLPGAQSVARCGGCMLAQACVCSAFGVGYERASGGGATGSFRIIPARLGRVAACLAPGRHYCMQARTM